jgi:hypothetical protein
MPKRLPVPHPRPFRWPLKPVQSAACTYTQLPNGQLVLTIDHDLIRGVTPPMLVWWFEHLGERMDHEGASVPRYLVWHPVDHIHWELARRGPDGGTGQGAHFRIVETFGDDPDSYVDSVEYVERLDAGGLSLVRRILGMEVFRLEHRFRAVAGGTEYRSRMVLGSAAPVVGPLFNRWLRPRFLTEKAARAWLRHNVEEVGVFEHILPALYRQHVTDNVREMADAAAPSAATAA